MIRTYTKQVCLSLLTPGDEQRLSACGRDGAMLFDDARLLHGYFLSAYSQLAVVMAGRVDLTSE